MPHEALSQAEVALVLGISRARVWQIEKKALAKLRRIPVLLQLARDCGLVAEESTSSQRPRSPLGEKDARGA